MPENDRDAGTMLTYRQLLGRRLFVQAHVRLIAAALIAVGAFFARDGLGIENLDVTALLWLAAAVALYDIAVYVLTWNHRQPGASPVIMRQLRITMLVVIALDFFALTAAVWFVGGARSPFLSFFLLHVILSCLLLTRREAVGVAIGAYAIVTLLVIGEWQGFIRPRLPEGAIVGTAPFDARYVATELFVYGLLILVTVVLMLTLVTLLRAGEQRLRIGNEELERLSTIRRDFLHIALHDFQAPLGVVTTNLRNLAAGLGGELAEPQQEWVRAALRRLDGINRSLADFRMLETLDADSIRTHASIVEVRPLLDRVADDNRDLADARDHRLDVEADAALPAVRAIPELLREAVAHYVTNAIKYTPEGGRIVLRAVPRSNEVAIEVEDNGIGIDPTDHDRLFEEFVRLDRAGTPVASATGTGLGLSIVRRIIDRLGGRIEVESRRGEGSTFRIILPVADDSVVPAA